MKVKNTSDVGSDGIKVLTYSESGVGKTTLCKTAPRPLVISVESGLLSLVDAGLPYLEVKTLPNLIEIYDWLDKGGGKEYQTICLDSITEIAEVVLRNHKGLFKDPRQAYGVMNDDMADIITKFRDLKGKNVYMTAKILRFVDDSNGSVSYLPSMPGKRVLNDLPFYFDEVFAMRIGKDSKGKKYRYLQTQPDYSWTAKDRSGKLDEQEKPNLSHIFDKIMGKEKDNGTTK